MKDSTSVTLVLKNSFKLCAKNLDAFMQHMTETLHDYFF